MSTENKWIPITERLPEDRVQVLLYFGGLPYELGYMRKCDRTWWRNDCHLTRPIAWQPVPDPPPKPDAFEEFWNSYANGRDRMMFQGEIVTKRTARFFWDNGVAAVNAGKVV